MGNSSRETQKFEKKSIKILHLDLKGNSKIPENDRENIARHAVAFANADGGKLIIGIENTEDLPPSNQVIIDLDLPNKIKRRISELTHNVAVKTEIKKYENGGETIEIEILPSRNSIAATNDGKYYLRVSDSSVALLPEDLAQLLTDKPSFIWETKQTKVLKNHVDDDKLFKFIFEIRNSKKPGDHVKKMSDEEILEHYFFVDGDYLTNLGVLWIGLRKDRGNLSYCPTIHFIKYDEREEKVNKITWDDYYLNPQELLEAALTQIPDWMEGVEVPCGMFRKFIKNYSDVVLRELIVNALIHRPYNQRGEILILLHSDYLEIKNPGRFPIGVNAKNFLHKSIRRNEKMAKVFSHLGLMEAEGSGIDKIYHSLLTNGKGLPTVFEDDDSVSIKIEKRIIKEEIIELMMRANEELKLTEKELISLGIIAENNSISALEFEKKLELECSPSSNPTRQWLGNLLELNLVKSKGKTKAVEYFLNPEFLKRSNFRGRTTLKNIEPHRLEELIRRDLVIYQPSPVSAIHKRLGGEKEIKIRTLRSMLSKMIVEGLIRSSGKRRWVKYSINLN